MKALETLKEILIQNEDYLKSQKAQLEKAKENIAKLELNISSAEESIKDITSAISILENNSISK